jgi:hypothetical protein
MAKVSINAKTEACVRMHPGVSVSFMRRNGRVCSELVGLPLDDLGVYQNLTSHHPRRPKQPPKQTQKHSFRPSEARPHHVQAKQHGIQSQTIPQQATHAPFSPPPPSNAPASSTHAHQHPQHTPLPAQKSATPHPPSRPAQYICAASTVPPLFPGSRARGTLP